MQRDFNKCGGDAFVIEVLEVVSETDDLIAREQHWLDTLQIGMNNSTLAKALKREAQVIRDGFCVSYAPINPAMVAWPYRRGCT